ncbi:gliding motility lipoprotein GldH [Jiulongibacter sediminis]|uniref:gliding motility lipoprotein GldH n=1 Tax=Jiulongibacter sediminis TaxID=1605367 RepID=UPI0026F079BF|nr:gliding motility lipoprotein GldH [Jiulongibacter sediminis]
MNKIIIFLFAAGALWACNDAAIHKEIVDFKDAEWAVDDIQKFIFEVKDNTKSYSINYMLRNAAQYPFYNIYLKSWLKDSTGASLESGMEELMLFNEKSGKPLGDGLGDLFDHKIGAAQYRDIKFPYNGTYTFELQQNMRPDPLLGIMSVGFEVVDNTAEK